MEAVAVLDVTSVKTSTKTETVMMTTIKLIPCKPVNWLPNHSDKPVSTNPPAIASPPPNSNKIPQGNFIAVSQSNKRPPFTFGEGIANKTIAKNIAISPSLKPSINFDKKNDLEIQKNTDKMKRINTNLSTIDAFP